MAVVLVILSVIMYMIYSLVPANRAYTDAYAQVQAMKNSLPKEQLNGQAEQVLAHLREHLPKGKVK